MEEGTYGSPFYQQPASGPPVNTTSTAPASAFKANVARKKTRKWVEARKINYDGSGWGDEDEEEDDDEDDSGSGAATPSDPALPPMPSATGTPRLPSQQPPQQLHHPAAAPAHAAARGLPSVVASRSATPSSLHARNSPSPARSAAAATGEGSTNSNAYPVSPAATNPPTPWVEGGRAASPLGARGQSPASAGHRPFVRPSDIYKRAVGASSEGAAAPAAVTSSATIVEPPELVARGRTAAPAGPAYTAPAPPAAVAPAVASPAFTAPQTSAPTYSVFPKTSPTSSTLPPTTPTRKDDPLPPLPPPENGASVPPAQPLVHRPQDSVDSTTSAASEESSDLRRFSTSPKLPDLARFSTFSPDLLFGGAGFLSPTDAPPVPSLPASPAVASFPRDNGSGPTAASQLDAVAHSSTEPVPPEEDRRTPTQQQEQTGAVASAGEEASALRDSSATTTAPSWQSAEAASPAGAGDNGPEPLAVVAKGDAEAADDQPAATTTPDELQMAMSSDQIPATAPLNPRRSSHLFLSETAGLATTAGAAAATTVVVPPYDLAPVRMGSTDTATGSPMKETDILSDEIIRTLSPVGLTAEPATIDPSEGTASAEDKDGQQTSASAATSTAVGAAASSATATPRVLDRARTPTRESSYLQSVYDDYLPADSDEENNTGSGNAGAANAACAEESTPHVGPALPLAAAAAATAAAAAGAATAAHLSSGSSSADPDDSQPTAAHEAEGSPMSPVQQAPPGPTLRRQFSWEMGAENKETAPVSAPPPSGHPALRDQATAAPVPAAIPPPAATLSEEDEDEDEGEAETGAAVAIPTAAGAEAESRVESSRTPDESPAAARVVSQAPPPLRSMLDVDDGPVSRAAPVSVPAAPQAAPQSAQHAQQQQRVSMAASSLSPTQSLRTVQTGQSVGPDRGSLASASSVAAAPQQFLTLRQCMAYNSHAERMAKLAEARREYAAADSGLAAWLTAMTTAQPEYRAPFASVWGPGSGGGSGGSDDSDGGDHHHVGGNGVLPLRRPVAAHVPHVPHVSMPSSTQISHKSKELLAATGKAGKGLLALRKKGFHKKAAN